MKKSNLYICYKDSKKNVSEFWFWLYPVISSFISGIISFSLLMFFSYSLNIIFSKNG